MNTIWTIRKSEASCMAKAPVVEENLPRHILRVAGVAARSRPCLSKRGASNVLAGDRDLQAAVWS
jgi:hypothetical protein